MLLVVHGSVAALADNLQVAGVVVVAVAVNVVDVLGGQQRPAKQRAGDEPVGLGGAAVEVDLAVGTAKGAVRTFLALAEQVVEPEGLAFARRQSCRCGGP